MIEIHLGTRGASANVDGRWHKSSSPAELIRNLMRAGHTGAVRVHAGYEGAYTEYPSPDSALRGVSARAGPRIRPAPDRPKLWRRRDLEPDAAPVGAPGEVVTMRIVSTSLDTLLVVGNVIISQTGSQRAAGLISVRQGDQQAILTQQDVAEILPELKAFIWRRP